VLESQSGDVAALALELARRKRELDTALTSMSVAREHAEQATRVKSDFLKLVSHELRTPLTSLQIDLQRLSRSDEQPAKQRTLLERALRSSGRLMTLVESLLEYSRMQSDKITLQLEEIDLAALVFEVVEELRPQAEEKKLLMQIDVHDDTLPIVSDKRIVRLIVGNLLVNAIKYTPAGEVSVRISNDGNAYQIEVRDTGVGISREDQARIFEPFTHVEPVTTKHTPGIGLGLALVKQMVTTLGGKIVVSSTLNAGSIFTVTLYSAGERRPVKPRVTDGHGTTVASA